MENLSALFRTSSRDSAPWSDESASNSRTSSRASSVDNAPRMTAETFYADELDRWQRIVNQQDRDARAVVHILSGRDSAQISDAEVDHARVISGIYGIKPADVVKTVRMLKSRDVVANNLDARDYLRSRTLAVALNMFGLNTSGSPKHALDIIQAARAHDMNEIEAYLHEKLGAIAYGHPLNHRSYNLSTRATAEDSTARHVLQLGGRALVPAAGLILTLGLYWGVIVGGAAMTVGRVMGAIKDADRNYGDAQFLRDIAKDRLIFDVFSARRLPSAR